MLKNNSDKLVLVINSIVEIVIVNLLFFIITDKKVVKNIIKYIGGVYDINSFIILIKSFNVMFCFVNNIITKYIVIVNN